MHTLSRRALLLAALLGILVGLGSYTFQYGEGLSYFSTDPAACKNCHIMNEEYNSWTKGPHHGGATCVDCHLPHAFLAKYLAKADHGFRHSKGFTLQDFHEPIMIKPKDLVITQENCLRCHSIRRRARRSGENRLGEPCRREGDQVRAQGRRASR